MRILIATVAATLAASLLGAAAASGKSFHPADAAQLTPPAPAPKQRSKVATDAVPGLVWRSGTATLTLMDRDCPFAELALQLETEAIAPARAYVVEQRGRKSIGCWAKDVGGDVTTMEPGRDDVGQIPIDWFRVGPGA